MLHTKNEITQEGYDSLYAEREHLIQVVVPANKEQLVTARAQGDLSENADYDAAKNDQAKIEGRIAEITAILDNSVIVKKVSNIVALGSKVTVKRGEKEIEYMIVSTVEAKSSEGKISNVSPVGQALLTKHVGDKVSVVAPKSSYTLEIISIK